MVILLPAVLIAATLWNPRSLIPGHRPVLKVDVIDVGAGDCILVRTPTGRTMVIDGGGSDAGDHSRRAVESPIGEKVVVPFLRSAGVAEINVLLITHPHGDHVGGLAAVVRDMKVDDVLDGTNLPYSPGAYDALQTQIRAAHISEYPARRGATINFGDGVRGEILNPSAQGRSYGTGDDNDTINNYSAVLRLTYGKTVMLFDSDAESDAESNMLRAYPAAHLRADFLNVGLHGSRNTSSDAWLDAVQPRIAVISCAKNNTFAHPSPETLARLTSHHVRVLRTDRDGTIEIESDGTRLTAKTGL